MKTEGPVKLICGGVWMGDIEHPDPPSWYKPRFAMQGDFGPYYAPPYTVPFEGRLEIDEYI